MRKYAITFLLLCLYGLARGQTEGYSCYYWFDDDYASTRTVTSPSDHWQMIADASGLSESLHTIHLLVRDGEGRQSLPKTQLFMHTTELSEQSVAYYWFDSQQGKPQTSPMLQGSFDVDASALTDGFHSFHYLVAKNDGSISSPTVKYFVKMPKTDATIKGYYWFDTQTDVHEVAVTNGTFEVDASSLSDGFHRFHYQALHSNGTTSMPSASFFLKTAQVNADDELNCICTVDGQLRHIEKLSQQGGIIHWDLDMHDLTDGLHRIQLQTVMPSGAMSGSYTSYFMRVTTPEELGEMRCVYAIDDDAFNTDASVVGNNGSYHFDLDLSELNDGLHHISYMLYNNRGTNTKIQTRFFLKVPLGGNGINQYQYWLNDEGIETAKTVTLPQRVNPLQLMSLLPVESRPLRSSLFLFDVSSGRPMVYAKNTIHLRFYDAAMRFTDAAKDYADYSIGQEVSVIKTLESGVRETTAWPEENEIKWYQVAAERGDSLRFKLDHAATLQLFAPSGKEVYNVSGAESVSWGGLHAAESGTFYVALHDVTATQGDDITIDYEHIDKYAVLRQDVSLVGNGGCSTITFEGNGFRDLYAVDLYNEQGDSIKHIYIGHESDATTTVTFDFTGAALGDYHAKFHFTEDDKVFTSLVTVEEAVDIELATTVTYPSTFLRGTSTTYTVKITNKGNMTAYAVPIYTYIRSNTVEGINYIKFNGLNLASYAETVGIDDFDDEDKKAILEYSETLSDDWYFTKMKVEDESNPGDSIIVRSNYFFVDIAPNSEKVLELTVSTIEDGVFAYFTVPQEWITLTGSSETLSRSIKDKFYASEKTNKFCCIKEGVECFGDMLAFKLDVSSAVLSVLALRYPDPRIKALAEAFSWADCAVSATNTAFKAFGDYVCNADEEHTKFEIVSEARKHLQSILGASISCVSVLLGQLKKDVASAAISAGGVIIGNIEVGDILNSVSDKLFQITHPVLSDILGTIKCTKKLIYPSSNCCTGDCGGGGGNSNSVASLDPNDIYGYAAESGSHAVKDGLTDVYYRIEFENDPAFATAAAHGIMVTDTLDTTKFDLSTFAPTRVKIGEKSAELSGDKDFVTTIDMRPEINAIAQVEGTFDQQKGIARWHITSLDPMTMEPTDDVMQGVLPVNHNGNGIGELSYDITLKPGLAHGTEVANRACIVFDQNEPIMTPTWTNTIDRIAPESHVTNVKMLNDSTAAVSIAATDELSGPWRYDVYVQYGSGAWFLGAKDVPIDTTASVKVYEGINHGFYVVVTDSAGNVEQKEAAREYTFEVFGSQTETNTKIQLAQGWNWISHNQDATLSVEAVKPHTLTIVSRTAELQKNSQQGWIGYLEELLPTEMYKVQATDASGIQLSGLLFNAAFRSIPLAKGWNWIGYPVVNVMSVSEALTKLKADEDDAIMSQDGIALFSDGNWTGTLTTMTPGVGYMYRSSSDKSFFLNASAQASARKIEATPKRDGMAWTADKRKYRNVMGLIGHLYKDESLESNDDWIVGAFCNDECRGIAQDVDGHLMMNVFGEDGETIVFRAMRLTTGEILPIVEEVPMCSDLLGNFHSPYDLHIGSKTGIVSTEHYQPTNNEDVYDVQGRKVDKSRMKKGVYVIVNDHQKQIQKVIK